MSRTAARNQTSWRIEKQFGMIKYIGSKRTLVPRIVETVRKVAGGRASGGTVLDLFSGTSRVGHALKAGGFRVIANDHNAYAHALASCYVQADAEDVSEDAAKLVRELNALPGRPGYFTEMFCVRSRFFQPHNGERVDAIREAIAAKGLGPELEAVLLTSLMEAADRVDSTTGLQMAFLKSWSPRSHNRLELRLPALLPRAAAGKGVASCLDVLDAAARFEGDVAYLDPPYNQHSYLGNYHVWESLVRWDKPEVYGIACKRCDVRQRRSAFNSRRSFASTLHELLRIVRAPVLIVSMSSEGFLSPSQMWAMLEEACGGKGSGSSKSPHGDIPGLFSENLLEDLPDNLPVTPPATHAASVSCVEVDFKRYVGAQIGIYNPRGEKVGRVGSLRNREYIFVATRG